VLSDAAALGLDSDPDRCEFLWLGDLSRAEANAHLDAANVLAGEVELPEAVFGVTTRPPAALAKHCRALAAAPRESIERIVRGIVEAKRKEAESRVFKLLSCNDSDTKRMKGLHFRHLLKDMVKNGSSLPKADAPYMMPLKHVAPRFQKFDYEAIMYDLASYEYRFSTPADMLAAAKLC
jgi:hypothetical protein